MGNDLISRSALLEKLAIRADKNYMDECVELTIREDMHEVEVAPAVDAVEVVRCRDCEHYEFGFCMRTIMYSKAPNGFCESGERRADE